MLLPLRRPTIGIGLGGKTLGLAVRGGGRGVRALEQRALPDGLVRISAGQLNITDPEGLAAELRGLLEGHRRGARLTLAALSLPDLCARTALFDFESWPRKAAERDALVRWRFQKDLNVALNDARVSFRVFGRQPSESPTDGGGQGAVRVLAVAVRRDILTQYEHVCVQAEILPAAVGLAGLQVYELCRPIIAAAMPDSARQFGFLYLTEESFVFLAFRNDCPLYLRIKPLRPAVHREAPAVWQEVVATLQFYDERFPCQGETEASSPFPLFCVGGPAGWSDAPVPEPAVPGLAVRALGWDALGPLCRYEHAAATAPPALDIVPALSAVQGAS